MSSPRLFWAFTALVIPMVVPPSTLAQSTTGTAASDAGKSDGHSHPRATGSGSAKASRRSRSRAQDTSAERTATDGRTATNDWNPHYIEGKKQFIEGHYKEALVELELNVAECAEVDLESMRRQNSYFDHIINSVPGEGRDPRVFLRSSNLQWVGATLAAQGEYARAEMRFTEMAKYAEQCFPGRLSTFAGCGGQGLAFLMAARGKYDLAAAGYRLALGNIEANQAQVGVPPAPCVSMILAAQADVELARGRLKEAEHCIGRALRVQEVQRELGLGPAPLDRATLLIILAQVRRCQERSSQAYDLFVQAHEIIGKIRTDHPTIGYCLDGLGEIDLARGRLDQGERHFRESLDARRKNLGERHREAAYSLLGLARIALARHDEDAAESNANEAWSILNDALGPAHPDVVDASALCERSDKGAENPSAQRPKRVHVRFLAIPTLVTLGWQVLHLGKDWRPTEVKLRWQDARSAH